MKKVFDENGNLTEPGQRIFIDLKYGLGELMSSDEVNEMSEDELLILGDMLVKMMRDTVFEKISKKQSIQNQFAQMSDEDFETYLKEKYGSIWQFVSLTEEEYNRVKPISQKRIEELLKGNDKAGSSPCNCVRFPRRCSKNY